MFGSEVTWISLRFEKKDEICSTIMLFEQCSFDIYAPVSRNGTMFQKYNINTTYVMPFITSISLTIIKKGMISTKNSESKAEPIFEQEPEFNKDNFERSSTRFEDLFINGSNVHLARLSKFKLRRFRLLNTTLRKAWEVPKGSNCSTIKKTNWNVLNYMYSYSSKYWRTGA